MQVGFVVLYVNESEACLRFWTEQVGMVEKGRNEAAGFAIPKVGFADQSFAFQLVPLALMQDNPDKLDLATPSICFQSANLEATRAGLVERGVNATEVGDHHGMRNFAFCDNEGRWFAVTG
jgi:lactoylglutathione lyase